jgi:hypothetical protein
MKANAKILGIGCAAVLSCSLAFAQLSPTNTTGGAMQPTPIVHNDRQSHDTATNAIVDPAGALATNRIPAVTNVMPSPLAPPRNTPPPN